MAKSLIFQEDETPVLRQNAAPVSEKDLGGKKLAGIIADMKKALAGEDDGVAIAAPQIGVPLRMFVVAGRAHAYIAGKEDSEAGEEYPDEVFINPEIVRASKEKKAMEEGCLSVRWLYGKVKRSTKVEIEYTALDGKRLRRGASGLLAQIFQHEIDHLNGILFIDTATDLHEWQPQETARSKKKTTAE